MQKPTVNQTEQQQKLGEKLINIIRIILITEKEAEELKITLAENIRFDVSDAFRAIDQNMKGYIIPQDIFRFMSKNGYSVTMKFCDFWINQCSKGNNKLTYQNFLEFIVPRYDRDAAMQCIVRKLYSEAGQCTVLNNLEKLSFYLEEFVAKLLYKELEFAKTIEIEKMNLAQLVEWKFTTVFKYVAGNLPIVDKRCLDALLHKFELQPLTQQDYNMFLKRFNRNDDVVFQRDEFSDAIFPSGYLMQEKDHQKDGFSEYVLNQNQQLDQYLGRDQQQDEDDFIFRPEDHKINTSQQEELVKDKELRKYLQEDPQLSVSHFAPVQQGRIAAMSFKPQFPQPPQQDQQSEIFSKGTTPIKPKTKKYLSPNEVPQQQTQDLLQQFERKQNTSQMPFNQDNNSAYYNQQFSVEQSQQIQYNQYVNQPTNAQLLLSMK